MHQFVLLLYQLVHVMSRDGQNSEIPGHGKFRYFKMFVPIWTKKTNIVKFPQNKNSEDLWL